MEVGIRFIEGEYALISDGSEILRSPNLLTVCQRGFELLPPRPPRTREATPFRRFGRIYPARYAIYEWVHPDTPTVTRYCGYGSDGGQNLWDYRDAIEAPLGTWLRQLDRDGLKPEYGWYRLGEYVRQPARLVRPMWLARLDALRGDALLNLGPPGNRKVPLKRVFEDRREDRYATYHEASRATGHPRSAIRRWMETGRLDPDKAFWTPLAG